MVWGDERLEQRLPSRQGRLLFAYLVYDRLRTGLREELGIAPSARVQELHAQLLQSA